MRRFHKQLRMTAMAGALTLSTIMPALADVPLLIGIGASSCATWTPNREVEVRAYIYGFWSGLNTVYYTLRRNGSVGVSSDALGKVGEVQLVCRNHPSMPISEAIMRTYFLTFDKEAKAAVKP